MRLIDTERRDYQKTTPLMEIVPSRVKVLSTSAGTLAYYQPLMSKAIWRPAFGRKLGFLVVQDDWLLGLIFLATPVMRLTARDQYLFPPSFQEAHPELRVRGNLKNGLFDYGRATRSYMDMSVCVSSQPVGWYWNLGKLVALIAPTLGDYVQKAYPDDEFKGVTTTSLWGRSTQYNRIYKFLGYTKGFGHTMVTDDQLESMIRRARARCPNCTPGCKDPLPLIPKGQLIKGKVRKDILLPESEWCVVPYCRFGDGANPRMRRIAQMWKYFPEEKPKEGFNHGDKRGVYFHSAVSPTDRLTVIEEWYERWGRPRYERVKNLPAPYQNGLEGRPAPGRE